MKASIITEKKNSQCVQIFKAADRYSRSIQPIASWDDDYEETGVPFAVESLYFISIYCVATTYPPIYLPSVFVFYFIF